MKQIALALLMSATLLTAVAEAQREGSRGRGGRGSFGGGGFGMMGGGGAFNSLIALAGREPVQKELGLKEDQISTVKAIAEDMRDEQREAFESSGFASLRDLPEEEREAKRKEAMTKLAETSKKINEKFEPKLIEALNKTQLERLKQIKLQVAGAAAFSDPEVIKMLDLTKEQQDKLKSITEESQKKQAALFRGRGGDRTGGGERPSREELEKIFAEGAKKREELTKERDEAIKNVLTADQQKKLEAAKGKTFDTAQLRMNAFGGGRGRGGEGGGGEGRGRRGRRGDDTEKQEKPADEKAEKKAAA